MFWHTVWREADSPSNGILHRIKTSCTLKYNLAITVAFTAEYYASSDKLVHYLLNKSIPDFWKTWNRTFSRNLASHTTIDGHGDDAEIARVFANKCCSVYYDSAGNTFAMQEYVNEFQNVLISNGYECD